MPLHIIYVLSSLPNLKLSVSEVVEEKQYSMCEVGLLFGHKLSHLKFEIHVVVRLSQWRLQTRCQNINSSQNFLTNFRRLVNIGPMDCTSSSYRSFPWVRGERSVWPLKQERIFMISSVSRLFSSCTTHGIKHTHTLRNAGCVCV